MGPEMTPLLVMMEVFGQLSPGAAAARNCPQMVPWQKALEMLGRAEGGVSGSWDGGRVRMKQGLVSGKA